MNLPPPGSGTPAPSRFRVEIVEVGDGIYGPDHPWINEHRVIETATGRIVLRFEERPDLSRAYDPTYEGVSRVAVAGDDAHVLVHHHDGRVERVAIPGA